MANDRMNKNQDDKRMGGTSPNQTMQHEQAKGSIAGQRERDEGAGRSPEKGGLDKDRFDKERFDKERQEKSAIGGGQSQTGQTGQTGQGMGERNPTGEPGRARNELDEKSRSDQKRSEPAGR